MFSSKYKFIQNFKQDFKQTKRIANSSSDCSPEFFDYFDLKCPLTSRYSGDAKRLFSLAEQLELGQVVFELWSVFVDPYTNSKSDILLGTCSLPLEPLLENRIGIRGWFPVKSVAKATSNNSNLGLLSTLLNDNDIGALEVALRFTKPDDFLRVIEAALQIGWNKMNQTGSSSSFKPAEDIAPTVVKHQFAQYPKTKQASSIKCLIEIDKALHLPLVFDEKLNQKIPPNVFVSFTAAETTSSTNEAERQLSPAWHFQSLANLDQDYFLDANQYFIFSVWHKSSNSSSNKLLGSVSVDVTPLLCGLSQINGWYNINDSAGQTQGQLKINIVPQESVAMLKQTYERSKEGKKSDVLNSNRFDSYSQCSFASLSSNSNEAQKQQQQRVPSSSSTSSVHTEIFASSSSCLASSLNSSAPIKSLIKDTNELKIGLAQKLTELDHLNRMLKERLENKRRAVPSNNNEQTGLERNRDFGSQTNLDQSVEVVKVASFENETAKKIPENVAVVAVVGGEEILLKSRDANNESEKKTELSEVIAQPHGARNNPNNSIIDSFWASFNESINNDSVEALKESSGKPEDSDTCVVGHLPPIAPANSERHEETNNMLPIDIVNEANLTVDSDPDDTELDQTVNLNVSFEFLSNGMASGQVENSGVCSKGCREEEVVMIDSYDIVDKIIDCSELANDDDEEEIAVEVNHLNNVSLFLANCEAEENNNNNDEENVTIVVPEELNKINETVQINVLNGDETNENNVSVCGMWNVE